MEEKKTMKMDQHDSGNAIEKDIEKYGHLYYVGMRGMTLDKTCLQLNNVHFSTDEVSTTDDELILFCDVHYPVSLSQDDYFTHLKVKQLGQDEYLMLPISCIRKNWPAGWPRAGIMIEQFIDIPWRLLKPVHHYIHDQYSLDALIQHTYRMEVLDRLPITMFYFEKVLPFIQQAEMNRKTIDESLFRKTLNAYYQQAITMHKEYITSRFNISAQNKPYTGMIISAQSLLSDEYDFNHNLFIHHVNEMMRQYDTFFLR